MTTRKHLRLYRYIERMHGEQDWGTMLDAGTGANSIRWMADLETERWTAITGSARQAERVKGVIKAKQRPQDQIILGNWADGQLLKDKIYDTVVADYLLGAIEGFAPYFQPYLFTRLRPLTGRVLYVTGLEPYVPTVRPDTQAGQMLWEIGRFRDACVLMAGGLPYREYPSQWVIDHIQRAGFVVRKVKHFDIGYKQLFVNAQIDIGLSGLETLTDHSLAQALTEHGEALRTQALEMIEAEGALRACRNYVIAAEPI